MLSSAMAFLLFGYDQGVFGGLIATPQLLNGLGIASTDADLQGTVVAIYDIGCLTGCIGTAVFGMKIGRRVLILVGCCFLILGAGLQGGATSVAMMIGGRVVAGLGTGINSSIIPVWVSECAHASRRGALVSIQISLVIMGLVLSYWFDYGTTTNLKGSVVWRLPLYFQIVFCVLTILTVPLLPESPRYLYSKGHYEEADSVIARIYAVEINHPTVLAHHAEVIQALEIEHEVHFRLKDIVWDQSPVNTTWRIWICVLIQLLQQLGGICLIAYYASYLFINNLGMSQHSAGLTSGGLSCVFWGGTLTAIFTVDRVGRRPVLLWGAVGCATCMICYTVGLAVYSQPSLTMATVFIFLFEFCYGCSWCGLPFLYAAEVTPLHVRHVGSALSVGMEWLMTFVVVKTGPIGITNAGWKFYLLFCIGNVLQVFFIYFFVKETKGLTLEEIDVLYAKPAHREELTRKLHFEEHKNAQDKVTMVERGSGSVKDQERFTQEQIEFHGQQ
jgi:sugar porter (SP) family MFS transporter